MVKIRIIHDPDKSSGTISRRQSEESYNKGRIVKFARDTGNEYRQVLQPKKSDKRMEFNPDIPKTLTPKGYARLLQSGVIEEEIPEEPEDTTTTRSASSRCLALLCGCLPSTIMSNGSRTKPDEFKLLTNMANKQYTCLVNQLNREGKLWEDPDFPANDESLGKEVLRGGRYEWKRPHEISQNAQLFTGGISRFDIKQGALGNCWFIAVVASIANYPQLFDHVLPKDQPVQGPGYCGLIRCRFWRFGTWVDVFIDDRLPVKAGTRQLAMMHSSDENEFWSALVEKAYAKLNGCYSNLSGGLQSEAMEDLTGGICQTINLHDKENGKDLFKRMKIYCEKCCLMGCALESTVCEQQMENGLIGGHAYSVTGVHSVKYQGRMQDLVRIRNPWGNRYEWNGPWSDKSSEWKAVSEADKKSIQLTFESDGEFWMSFEDFTKYFSFLEVCYLGLESLEHDNNFRGQRRLEESIYSGCWERNLSAGGCINNRATFGMNPQFLINVEDPDPDDNDAKCTIYVGLMQKSRRSEGLDCETMGFMLYKAPEGTSTRLTKAQLLMRHPVSRSDYMNGREVFLESRLAPGQYIIVPTTFAPNIEMSFILRVFCQRKITDMELDDREHDEGLPNDVEEAIELEEVILNEDDTMREEFQKVCKTGTKSTDYNGLCKLLNNSSLQDVPGFQGFTKEMCRSMIASVDSNLTGSLEEDELMELWKYARGWKIIFLKHDVDKTGTFSPNEFREALTDAGYHVSNQTFSALVHRYLDYESSGISFEDFFLCMVRLKTAYSLLEAHPKNREKANLLTNTDFVRFMAYI